MKEYSRYEGYNSLEVSGCDKPVVPYDGGIEDHPLFKLHDDKIYLIPKYLWTKLEWYMAKA